MFAWGMLVVALIGPSVPVGNPSGPETALRSSVTNERTDEHDAHVRHWAALYDDELAAATDILAVHTVKFFIFLTFLACLSRGTHAQVLPFAPISPTEAKECQDFSARVEAYTADYNAQHEKCLAENKADRQDETHDSLVCSRSRCQILHDMLYDDSPISAKSKRKEVAACYEKVREYQAEEARKAKEKADREAKQQKEEEEEAAEAAQRKAARDAREVEAKKSAADRASAEKAAENKEAASKAEADRIAAQQNRQSVKPIQQSPANTQKSGQSSSGSSRLVDPFKDSNSKRQAQDIGSNASVVDPFAPSLSLVDPFGPSGTGRNKSAEESERAKAIFEFSTEAIQRLGDKAISKLGQDIDFVKSHSGKTITSAKANQLIHELQDTKSGYTALSRFITGGQYAVIVKSIVSAESQGERDEAEGALVGSVSSSQCSHSHSFSRGPRLPTPDVRGR